MASNVRPSGAGAINFEPMVTSGVHHLVDRAYREGGTFQWVRETYQNAVEANATRIEYGIEWQAVENKGVYRRSIADNGWGMDPDELVTFFNTFGGGGKPIGDLHENFGVGVKTSTLPWNKFGVVVVSWRSSQPSMIWIERDPETGSYGLRTWAVEDENGEPSIESVCYPMWDEEMGCDWSAIKPAWIVDHGTVLVLLGNHPTDNTVEGDPNRQEESDIKGISSYLNRRIWELPADTKVTVDELRTESRNLWPRSESIGHGPQPDAPAADQRTNLRTIRGAHYFIDHPGPGSKAGNLSHSGTVTLPDETAVDWYLWEGDRPAVQSYAALRGYIATLYKGELYDISVHPSTYRSFGVSEQAVRSNLWLIIRPPLAEHGKFGVYPKTDRSSLLVRGGLHAGGPLPINEWATEFFGRMPDPIRNAITAARKGNEGTIKDRSWIERLKERFGARWRMTRLRARLQGPVTVKPTQEGTEPIRRPSMAKKVVRVGLATPVVQSGTGGTLNTGSEPGSDPAVQVKIGGGIPDYRWVSAKDLGAAPGMFATWKPNDINYPQGVVELNTEHPVITEVIQHWQAQFPDIYADDIANDVMEAYGEVAVSKIAHSESLRGTMTTKVIETELRSDGALTLALLGLFAEEAVLAPRLGGRYGKRHAS